MADIPAKPGALTPMSLTITDKGETFVVSDVQRWIDERKVLLRNAREMMRDWNGDPVSLYKHYGKLVQIARRLAEIKMIFDRFNEERNRRADANIRELVAFFEDPATMAGIDD